MTNPNPREIFDDLQEARRIFVDFINMGVIDQADISIFMQKTEYAKTPEEK
jgi:hypothetical protein